MAELGGEGGEMVLAAGKRKRDRAERVDPETLALATQLSKTQRKKLDKIAERKAKEAQRGELYRRLGETQLTAQQLGLMQSSGSLGKRDTLRERITRVVQRAAAGIPPNAIESSELEGHPNVLAEVEDALGLSPGAANQAVRRSKGEVVQEEPEPEQQSGGAAAQRRKRRKAAARDGAAAAAAAPAEPSVLPAKRCAASSSSGSSSSSGGSDSEADNSTSLAHHTHKLGTHSGGIDGVDNGAAAAAKAASGRATGQLTDAKVGASSGFKVRLCEGVVIGSSVNGGAPAASAQDWAAKMTAGLSSFQKKLDAPKPQPPALPPPPPAATTIAAKTAPPKAAAAAAAAAAADGARVAPAAAKTAAEAAESSTAAAAAAAAVTAKSAAAAAALGKQAASVLSKGAAPALTASDQFLDECLPLKHCAIAGRPKGIQEQRMELPVCGMEQEIMEAMRANDVILVCAETGSGKSTQVPQFAYEAGYARNGLLIGVTQPRRVAAVSTAERVAYEMGTCCGVTRGPGGERRGGTVAYHIRHDSAGVTPDCRIKFMTDGILLREVCADLLLRKYGVIFLDEAHERGLNTDLLLGLLSRAVPLRRKLAEEAWAARKKKAASDGKPSSTRDAPLLTPLKVVIMSATLGVRELAENARLFPKEGSRRVATPPIVPSRQFPVTIHFSKRTEMYDYLGASFNKVCKIHRTLPPGAILLFLPGRREILHMCRRLRAEFAPKRGRGSGKGARKRGKEVPETASSTVQQPPLSTGDAAAAAAAAAGDDDEAVFRERDDEEIVATALESESESEGDDAAGSDARDDEEIVAPALESESESEGEDAPGSDAEDSAVSKPKRSAPKSKKTPGGATPGSKSSDSSDSDGDSSKGGADDAGGDGSMSSDDDDNIADDIGERDEDEGEGVGPVWVLPLYAMLTPQEQEQARVFAPPPEGHRLIVIATNVAETSVTIPGVRYVVDCGRAKERRLEHASGISVLKTCWVSQASADQRAGRAGRVCAGHCYRLYSSAVYTQRLTPFSPPEVCSLPLEDVVLQMKAMGIADVSNFPFPTLPSVQGLKAAHQLLQCLGALKDAPRTAKKGAKPAPDAGGVSALGRALALLPISPRYAKMLLLARQGGLLHHGIAMVAMLTERDPFMRGDARFEDQSQDRSEEGEERSPQEEEEEEESAAAREEAKRAERQRRNAAGQTLRAGGDALVLLRAASAYASSAVLTARQALRAGGGGGDALSLLHANVHAALRAGGGGDALVLLRAAGAYAHAVDCGAAAQRAPAFCQGLGLHAPTMDRALQLRRQLTRLAEMRFGAPALEDGSVAAASRKHLVPSLGPPTPAQELLLRQALLSGLLDCVAKRAPASTLQLSTDQGARAKGWRQRCAYLSCSGDVSVPLYIRHTSSVYTDNFDALPEWVAYVGLEGAAKGHDSHDFETDRNEGGNYARDALGGYAFMRCVTPIDPTWLTGLAVGTPLLRLGELLQSPAPFYDREKDAIIGCAHSKYGVHGWAVPHARVPVADAAGPHQEARWFARLLLEGKVDETLGELYAKGALSDPPSLLTRAQPNKKVALLLQELSGVTSLRDLRERWSHDRTFLRSSLALWVKRGREDLLEDVWNRATAAAAQ
ncbi:hypothetical protein JKP88DRAFT_353468 [Tribonema minus]|uniref:RNA helicase n=1 Tax=Tribonema minus TaxID=303371 RepID=A0A836CK38_9STRA|nr:hypothetical protein JKP88DRAFT_353468 [Tribonema minus]